MTRSLCKGKIPQDPRPGSGPGHALLHDVNIAIVACVKYARELCSAMFILIFVVSSSHRDVAKLATCTCVTLSVSSIKKTT